MQYVTQFVAICALALTICTALPPTPKGCKWHKLEQGGRPGHEYVLVCG